MSNVRIGYDAKEEDRLYPDDTISPHQRTDVENDGGSCRLSNTPKRILFLRVLNSSICNRSGNGTVFKSVDFSE